MHWKPMRVIKRMCFCPQSSTHGPAVVSELLFETVDTAVVVVERIPQSHAQRCLSEQLAASASVFSMGSTDPELFVRKQPDGLFASCIRPGFPEFGHPRSVDAVLQPSKSEIISHDPARAIEQLSELTS